jgi:predicted ATPase/DNA-binding SARP family transcriptional activator/Tfp pilus assembly protein PilF
LKGAISGRPDVPGPTVGEVPQATLNKRSRRSITRLEEMEFGLLGPLEVSCAGKPVELGGHKQRALLGVLVLNANGVIAADRLVELLWADEPPATAIHALHVHVSQLRKALMAAGSSARIRTHPTGYWIEVDPDELDVTRFEHLVATGRQALTRGSAQTALEAFGRALDLWRGPALADFVAESFAAGERARLEELRILALEGRFDAQLALGLHAKAVVELQSVAAEHPLRQGLQAQLMLALYRSGRQAEASDVFQRLRSRLRDELGMEPGPDLQLLLRHILTHDSALQVAPGSAKVGNLPIPLTDFIGRRQAVAKVRRLLGQHRLVTLLGVGGVGKTRLALEVASQLASEELAGVWLVDLSSVLNPARVVDAIATSLGLARHGSRSSRAILVERLSTEPAFLVLDNCEHLVAGCAEIVLELLKQTAGTRVLATSRQPLQVPGEVTWPVPPLTLPSAGGVSASAAVRASEAVQLFEARAKSADTDFELTSENVGAVVSICRGLDGIPLAIELAAALVRGMSPAEIGDRLTDRFGLLKQGGPGAPPRQRALAGALDWSHQLLSEPQQLLFRRLAIFAGSFDLASVEAVCADELIIRSEVANILLQLVDRSLVARDGKLNERSRYRLLETVRSYARANLSESGEEPKFAANHAAHHHDRAEVVWSEYPNTVRTHAELNADIDDIRAAIDWCCSEAPELGMEILGALGYFLLSLGYHREGLEWLHKIRTASGQDVQVPTRTLIIEARMRELEGDYDAALVAVEVALAQSRRDEDRSYEAEAQLEMGGIEINLGRYRSAGARLKRSLALFTQLGERQHAGRVLNELGLMAWHRGRLRVAQRHFEASIAAADRNWELANLAIPIGNLGAIAFELGELDRARSLTEQTLGLARLHGMRPTVVAALGTLGDIERKAGDPAAAKRHYSEALDLAAQLGLGDLVIENIEGIALVAHAQGLEARALRLLAAASASRKRLQLPGRPARDLQLDEVVRTERNTGGEVAEAEWRLGAALVIRDAVRYALELQDVAPPRLHEAVSLTR